MKTKEQIIQEIMTGKKNRLSVLEESKDEATLLTEYPRLHQCLHDKLVLLSEEVLTKRQDDISYLLKLAIQIINRRPNVPENEKDNIQLIREVIHIASNRLYPIDILADRKKTYLNLKADFSNEAIELIAESLKENDTIEELIIGEKNLTNTKLRIITEGLKINNGIRKLELGEKVNDSVVIMLAEMLKANEGIQYLEVHPITSVGAAALAEALKTSNSSLHILNGLIDNVTFSPGTEVLKEELKINDTIYQAIEDYAKTILVPQLLKMMTEEERQKFELKERGGNTGYILRYMTSVTKTELFKGLSKKETLAFANEWRVKQGKIRRYKDYNNIGWLTLFREKEINVPFMVTWRKGWKVVARTTSAELRLEGEVMEHCIGGATEECLIGNDHVLSIVGPNGPTSTVKIYADYDNKSLSPYQGMFEHTAKENNAPTDRDRNILKWLMREVGKGKLKVDYEKLAEARNERLKVKNSPEYDLVMVLGFNPFDKKKFDRLVEIYKEILPPQLRRKFSKFTHLDSIELDGKKYEDPSRQKKDNGSDGESLDHILFGKPPALAEAPKKSINNDDLLVSIQESLNMLFGEDFVTATIEKPAAAEGFGEVVLLKQPKCVIGMEEVLQEITEATRGKGNVFVEGDNIHIKDLRPLVVDNLFKGAVKIRKQQKHQELRLEVKDGEPSSEHSVTIKDFPGNSPAEAKANSIQQSEEEQCKIL
ncbi:MAG: hypothetical protein K0R25_578 [Rickettsiaceae bacterium]|jgi:hypothetical protein|nr:hypothetical protein [Rickettsiaceae bacterium]